METAITSELPPLRTEVEYALTREDFIACQLILGKSNRPESPPRRTLKASDFIVAFVVFAAISAALWTAGAEPAYVAAAQLAALAMLLFAFVLAANGPAAAPKDFLLIVKEHVDRLQALGVIHMGRRDRVTMDADGFTEVTEYRQNEKTFQLTELKETRACWSEVQGIVVAEGHIIFTIGHRGCLFVPRHAFANETEFVRFAETARELRKSFVARERGEITAGPIPATDDRIQRAP